MKKVVILCCLFYAVLLTNVAAQESKGEFWSQPPLGFYDPLGIVNSGDQATFNRLRYIEIKYGRVAMMAVVGSLAVELSRSKKTLEE